METVLKTCEQQGARAFIPEQRQKLLAAFQNEPSPLYMRLAFDFAHRNWHSYTTDAALLTVPATVEALINTLFDELEPH